MTSIDDSTPTPPGYWFGVIEGRLHQRMREALADLGLRRGSWRILHTLADGPATADELAGRVPHSGSHDAPGRPPFRDGGEFGGGRGRAHGYGRHPGWRSQEPRDEHGHGPEATRPDDAPSVHGHDHTDHGHDHPRPGHDHTDHDHDHTDHDHDHTDHGPGHDHDHTDHDHDHPRPGHGHGHADHDPAFERGYERGFDRGFLLGALRGPQHHGGGPWMGGSPFGGPGAHPYGYGHHPSPDASYSRHPRPGHRPGREGRRGHRIQRVQRILAEFVERGWVWFDGDRATLTDEGRAAHDAAFERVRAVRAELSEGISDADYATTLATLEAMARNLGWRPANPGSSPEDGQAGEPSMDA